MSLWNKVWSLDVPSKAKHLLWRISKDLLPEYRYIRRTVMPEDESCVGRDGKDIDVTHTLLECEYARIVWFACPLNLRVEDIIYGSLSESVSVLCDIWDDDTLALWAMVAWCLWFKRNKHCQRNQDDDTRWQIKQGYDPLKLINKALHELSEFQNQQLDAMMIDLQDIREEGWVSPPRGWVKLNFHLSRFRSTGTFVGGVIRDDAGDVLGSFVDRLDVDDDLSLMKAHELAAYESLLFAFNMGFRLIILESDYSDVVDKLQAMEWETSPIANIRVGRKPLCSSDYDIYVYYVSRDHNQLATSVARYAREVDDFRVWIDALPYELANIDAL